MFWPTQKEITKNKLLNKRARAWLINERSLERQKRNELILERNLSYSSAFNSVISEVNFTKSEAEILKRESININ